MCLHFHYLILKMKKFKTLENVWFKIDHCSWQARMAHTGSSATALGWMNSSMQRLDTIHIVQTAINTSFYTVNKEICNDCYRYQCYCSALNTVKDTRMDLIFAHNPIRWQILKLKKRQADTKKTLGLQCCGVVAIVACNRKVWIIPPQLQVSSCRPGVIPPRRLVLEL